MNNDETIGNSKTKAVDGEEMHPLEKVASFGEHMEKDIEGSRKRKTVEEKAKEKGYRKNKDGLWVKHDEYGFDEKTGRWGYGYGEGSDELVEWFKLDEEYLDLADKTEELAEEYNVNYNDYYGLKMYVYENAANLEKASDSHLENIFKVAELISFYTGGTEKKLVEYDPDDLEIVYDFLDKYYDEVANLMPEHELDDGIMKIGECLVRNFNRKIIEGDFFESLVKYSVEAFLNSQKRWGLMYGIESGIEGLSRNEDSGNHFGNYMEYLDELIENDKKDTEYKPEDDVLLCKYVYRHGVNDSTIRGFRNVVFPLVRQRDSEVRPIIEGGNAYGVAIGTYGIADYIEECLLSSYNPRDINKLIRIYYEIPTSDYRKFEQNRKDAARLQGTIIGGRDFIHDEKPGVNEVLVAIKDYYENRDSESNVYKHRLVELEDKYHFGVLPNAFKIEAYGKPIEYMSEDNYAEEGNTNETALDILNRLIENTRPNLLEAPKTKDEDLNRLMKSILPTINERTNEVLVDFDKVGVAVMRMNEILLQNKGKQGIYPSVISAIAFLDKMSAYALRNADKKDLQELPFDSGFKGMVRFSQLTSSMEYDENNFENKYRQIVDKFSEAYGDDGVDSSKLVEGYRLLSLHILKNVEELSRNYASKPVTARFNDAVWSGNLCDELLRLFDRVFDNEALISISNF